MIGRISESKIRWVRWGLVVAWLLLIVSLFYDPITSAFTRETALNSPFRLNRAAVLEGDMGFVCPYERSDGRVDWGAYPEGDCDPRCTRIRDACVVERPYPMGARIFWTMALPLLPMAFMFFGHEAWRRVCPLSTLMQVPRMLGIQRKRRTISMKTGKVDRRFVFIKPDSLLGRAPTVLPFVLLCLGVTIRLLFINSDRVALAVFFLLVIAIAMIVGYLYGGKTWCHYVCPLGPVQKIYTEPRGIVESRAHTHRSSVSQSMCRTATKKGDVSACVTCISDCPDIDLERQYWARIQEPGRPFVHYGYVGMILGFYGYYALYAGNWGYYFTGAWTHEEGQLAALSSPGFWFLPEGTWFTKVYAAPLTIALSVLFAYGLGRAIEVIARELMRWRGRVLDEDLFRHRSYVVSAFVAINSFYLFGGRPNIALLPSAGVSIVDITIVLLSTLWLTRSWPRERRLYEVESLASRLRKQLRELDIDIEEALGDRSINDLSDVEVYSLSKVLPQLDGSSKRKLFLGMMRDEMRSASAALGGTYALAEQLAEQLGLNESEMREGLRMLGLLGEGESVDATSEHEHRLVNYTNQLSELVARELRAGRKLTDVLADTRIGKEMAIVQGAYFVTDDQVSQVLDRFLSADGALVRTLLEPLAGAIELRRWQDEIVRRELGTGDRQRRLGGLLNEKLKRERMRIVRGVLVTCASLGETREGESFARLVATRVPHTVLSLLDTLNGEAPEPELSLASIDFSESVLAALRAQASAATVKAARALVFDPEEALERAPGASAATHLLHAAWLSFDDPGLATAYARLTRDALTEECPAYIRDALDHVVVSEGRSIPPFLEWTAIIQPLPMYRNVRVASAMRLVSGASVETVNEGESLVRQGDQSDALFCVLDGMFDVYIDSGGQDLRVASVGAGEVLGELGLLNSARRSATVRGAAHVSTVLRIERTPFMDYVDRESTSLLRAMSLRLRSTLAQQTK